MLKTIYKRLSKGRLAALLLLLLAIVTLEVVMTCMIPVWREYFYNILQAKHAHLFSLALTYFFAIMTALGAAQGLKTWVSQLLAADVRKYATKVIFKKWIRAGYSVKNYSQAMGEAVRNFTELFLEVSVECVISLAIVIVLIVANIHNLPIVIASLIYTAVASAAAALFNRPLMTRDKVWQTAEGDLREAFGDIANDRGDYSFKEKLRKVLITYYSYIKITMWYTLFTRLKSNVATLVPYILLSSAYFAGAMTLGDFMSGAATFELIVVNSTILILLYPKLTKTRASYQLTKEFYDASVKGQDHDK